MFHSIGNQQACLSQPDSRKHCAAAHGLLIVCCSGPQNLSVNGNVYIAGVVTLAIGLMSDIELEIQGTGGMLVSTSGGTSFVTQLAVGPAFNLLDGALQINLAGGPLTCVVLVVDYSTIGSVGCTSHSFYGPSLLQQ